jgi:diguanylate cyclase (GGDEF)-like protein
VVGRTLVEGRPVWITNVADERLFRRRSEAETAGLYSAFAFPITIADAKIGVLEFFAGDIRQPDEILLRSAQMIGIQIGQFFQRKRAEQDLLFIATHDALTGLPNRGMFHERLNHALARARRHDTKLSICFIDLDRFKNINDTLGHEAGDRLLQEMGRRLGSCLRETDTVARQGGDEFIVLLEELSDPQQSAKIAAKILSVVATPVLLNTREYQLTASIGISTYPDDGQDGAALLKNADSAMYRAKELGKNNFQFYSAQMNLHSLERLELEAQLRRAIERNEFLLHYQPKVDIRTGQVNGVEALLRWQHPDRGLVPPMQFIPLAEETGLIESIGRWVLQSACRQVRSWQKQGLPPLNVAVNLSARQFSDENLIQDIKAALTASGLNPTHLELEITESMVMREPEKAIQTLSELSAMGLRVAIDDFGTGYSSLSALKRFPVHNLKIDRSFIKDIPGDADNVAITQAIIALAHTLRMTVIAEGVETKEQSDFLSTSGCDDLQGFFFSKPLPEKELLAFLHENLESKEQRVNSTFGQ